MTNFDICRYNVERIMSSNTLLSGERARRNKDGEPRTKAVEYNHNATNQINGVGEGEGEALEAENNNENGSEWKVDLYQSPQKQSNCYDQKTTMNSGNHRNSALSRALQDLIGIDSVGDSTKMGTHFSNPSSLVTSLSSSREGSLDKTGPTRLFPKTLVPSNILSPIATGHGVTTAWILPAASQLRPAAAAAAAMSVSHLPAFAAWNDT